MEQHTMEALSRPFAQNQVKRREGPRGIQLDYVAAHTIIGRLNEVLACDWSFDLLRHEVHGPEVVVVGRLTVHGEPELVKTAIGCAAVKLDRNGDPVSIGNDWKAASSDALKRAARLLGIGLELYGRESGGAGDEERRPAAANGNNGRRIRNPDSPLSLAQMKCVFAVAKSRGIHNGGVNKLVKEMFDKEAVDDLSKSEASALIDHLKQ